MGKGLILICQKDFRGAVVGGLEDGLVGGLEGVSEGNQRKCMRGSKK